MSDYNLKIKDCNILGEDLFFIVTNSVNTYEMQHYAEFHLGLYCLQKYPFGGFPEYKGLTTV